MKSYQAILSLLLQTSLLNNASSLAIPTPLIDFAIGGIAGGVGAFAAYPLDYITAQMQSGKSKANNGHDCLIDTMKEGGPLLLYRGAGVQVVGVAPEKAIKLNTHDLVKSLLTASSGGTITLGGEVMAGAIAGICQVIATAPLETIKVALQTSDKTLAEVMEDIGGPSGLFKGAEACMARDLVFNAILFPLYCHLRMVMPDFFAGSIAGVIATFVATPADVVKTRILSQNESSQRQQFGIGSPIVSASFPEPAFAMTSLLPQRRMMSTTAMSAMGKTLEPYGEIEKPSDRNPFVVGYKLAEKEGPMVLLSGVAERCLGSIPRFGLTLSLYDVLKTIVAQQHMA